MQRYALVQPLSSDAYSFWGRHHAHIHNTQAHALVSFEPSPRRH